MDAIENIKANNNGIVTAAIYISCTNSFDSEKVISEQLDILHKFVQANDIIIVDSYIDRDSTDNYTRLVADSEKHYFDVILVYGATTATTGLRNVIDILVEN